MKGSLVKGGSQARVESSRIARGRRIRAVVVIAMLVGIPFASNFLSEGPHKGAAPQSGKAAALLSDDWTGGNAETLLDNVEERLASFTGAVPEAFGREIGLLPNARDVRVSDDGQVVGYVVIGEEREVAGEVEALMRAKGWAALPLEGVSGATFVKSSGSLKWALASCTQVADAVSVVTRCLEVRPS